MQTRTKPQFEVGPQAGPTDLRTQAGPLMESRASSIRRIRLLWDERRFLGRAAVYSLIVGTLLAFVLPKRYEASTQLMPPDNQSSSGLALLAGLATRATGGDSGSGLGAVAGDLLGVKSSGALFTGILRSRTVEDRLVERFELRKVYWVKLGEDARQKLSDNTSISEDRKSGIITITVTDHDPTRSAALAQAYVEELNRLVAQVSTSSARREREFLEKRLEAVKLDLDQASREFSEFSSKNTTLDIKEQGKAMVESAAVLQGQLIAAESEQKGLEEIYTPNNVRVRSAQARVNELKRQLEKLSGKSSLATNDAPDANNMLYPSIRQLPLLGVRYADLYRRAKIEEVVYETLTQQYELAKVQEAKETPSVKVLDTPIVPERKSFPPRILIMLLCMGLGFCGSMFWVLGRSSWDEVDAGDPAKALAIEFLQTVNASMPWATPNGSQFQAVTHRIWNKLIRRGDSPSDRN